MATDRFIYEKVIDRIMEMISRENYAPGDKLPGVRDLSKQFECNLHTVRKAITFLQENGLIEQRGRLGNFVCRSTNHLVSHASSRVQIVSTRRIGILHWPAGNEFTSGLLSALERSAVSQELQLTHYVITDQNEFIGALHAMKRNHCRAAILNGDPPQGEVFHTLLKNLPLPVVLNAPIAGYENWCYEPSDFYAWFDRDLVQFQYRYFQRLGYENIFYFGNNKNGNADSVRCRCFKEFAAENGIIPRCTFAGNSVGEIDTVLDIYQPYRGNLAVFCFDDLDAMRLVVGAWKRGWKLPDDMALMGVHNFLFANHLDPRLTSVQFPYDYLATRILKRAMELAANELEFKSFDRVPLEIVLRQSCGGRKHHSPEELQQLISSLHAKCRLE